MTCGSSRRTAAAGFTKATAPERHRKKPCGRSAAAGQGLSAFAERVMAGLARPGGGPEGDLELVQIARLGHGIERRGQRHHLLGGVVELGLLRPDGRLGARVAVIGSWTKGGPGQFAHGQNNVGIFCGGLGVIGRPAIDHVGQTEKVRLQHVHGRAAVFDGVFGLGKLRCRRQSHHRRRDGQNQGCYFFHPVWGGLAA